MADRDIQIQTPKEVLTRLDRKSPCQVTCVVKRDEKEESFQGSSLHFNERGILVFCPKPSPLSTRMKLILTFPGFKNPIEVQGEVVWSNIYGHADTLAPRGMGVKFTNLERDLERLLAELASQFETQGSIYSCYYT